jgi:serine/threonine protein phosphatase 1
LLFRRLKSVARPAVPDGLRVYAIGDVHGRLDLFEMMLARIYEETRTLAPAQVIIIQLGDLIDRGPDSAGVVARAMIRPEFAELLVLAGNHEAAMLEGLDGNRDMLRIWLNNGGEATLRSWGIAQEAIDSMDRDALVAAAHRAIPTTQLAWLARRPTSVSIGDYYFVHAGVRPGIPLEQQARRDQLWIREDFLDCKRALGAMIVHGHSISEEVEERVNRIGIDTGAYHSGRLTALVLEGIERRTFATSGEGLTASPGQ